jgi:hypothetical protein
MEQLLVFLTALAVGVALGASTTVMIGHAMRQRRQVITQNRRACIVPDAAP